VLNGLLAISRKRPPLIGNSPMKPFGDEKMCMSVAVDVQVAKRIPLVLGRALEPQVQRRADHAVRPPH